ncbi:MAG: RpiB/LacA/LacB family sugar-phosphate isomerase [Lentisphaeraceae bacterium]|nr:RpiB/LacA/LacB family sugar-phosphate isomerase [Lentisphaeraceae bacterium]
MKIAIACDHAAYDFKTNLISILEKEGHAVTDYGCSGNESCDYPDFGIPAADAVSKGEADRALLICNNGIGMSILANKIRGVIAALVYSVETAKMTRQHHNSNVLCLGAQQFSEDDLLKFIDEWLKEEFEGGRHDRRIGKARALEDEW